MDAGKKVSGVKRHIAVALNHTEVTDRKGVLQVLCRCKPNKLGRVQSLLCDSSYVG
ncbi:hypothetical protein NOC27_2866 [Nitrosococcus oceani AFC27]|nr:hypothetical protein NOC27_2866 [Nitrosococcus oceani AFC27]GEM21340.1 hypothetical protein NONS58_27790 [Nitrosococcus oceani]